MNGAMKGAANTSGAPSAPNTFRLKERLEFGVAEESDWGDLTWKPETDPVSGGVHWEEREAQNGERVIRAGAADALLALKAVETPSTSAQGQILGGVLVLDGGGAVRGGDAMVLRGESRAKGNALHAEYWAYVAASELPGLIQVCGTRSSALQRFLKTVRRELPWSEQARRAARVRREMAREIELRREWARFTTLRAERLGVLTNQLLRGGE